VVAACLFLAIAGSGAAADTPNPAPLWNAYPLDDDTGSSASGAQNAATTTTPTQPAASPAAATTQSLTVTEKAGDGPPWALMAGAAGGGALFVVVLLTLQGRRARRRDEALVGVTDEWPWLAANASGEADEFRAGRVRKASAANGVAPEEAANGAAAGSVAERGEDVAPERSVEPAANGVAAEREGGVPVNGVAAEREGGAPVNGVAADREGGVPANGAAAEREVEAESVGMRPAFDVVEQAAVPRHRFDREVANERAVAARRGPICQVRWSAPGSCFYAVTREADGAEHRVAWSPPIEWGEAAPPDEESREARAALRVLAKDLRDKGWRPMRAKGEDFDETRWYARRFRLPVAEAEEVSSQRSGSARA
jgi:hypothetical protein